MAAETVVKYAVMTCGHERLLALPGGLAGARGSGYKTWDVLVPAVFGVPAGEFEAGWQAYLAARYAQSTDAGVEEQASE
jgi:hypothetical protein